MRKGYGAWIRRYLGKVVDRDEKGGYIDKAVKGERAKVKRTPSAPNLEKLIV